MVLQTALQYNPGLYTIKNWKILILIVAEKVFSFSIDLQHLFYFSAVCTSKLPCPYILKVELPNSLMLSHNKIVDKKTESVFLATFFMVWFQPVIFSEFFSLSK